MSTSWVKDLRSSCSKPMANAYIDHPIVDATELKGGWNFLIGWTPKAALQRVNLPSRTLFRLCWSVGHGEHSARLFCGHLAKGSLGCCRDCDEHGGGDGNGDMRT